MASSWTHQELADLANGKAQLEAEVNWGSLFDDSVLQKLKEYCWAFHSELEYVLVPYFVMSASVAGKHTEVHSGLPKWGRTNMYLLMCGNPGSGKSCGFDLVVNDSNIALEKELGFSPVSNDLSRTALLHELQKQTEENRPFLIIGSDEMGLTLNGETKDTKEWELKRLIYNNGFSGTDIVSERMVSRKKMNKVMIKKPHVSIIGMTQPKPMFDWIRTVSVNDDGLLERFLIWVVTQTEKKTILKNQVEMSENWPTACLTMLTQYHLTKPDWKYSISYELYQKVHQLEAKSTRKQSADWKQYLELLAAGKEEDARQFRRNNHSPIVRYTELVLRFALGVHLGFYALHSFLSGSTFLDEIPTEIDEKTLDIAIESVKRSLNQVNHFRHIALRKANAMSITQTQQCVEENKLRESGADEKFNHKDTSENPKLEIDTPADLQTLIMEKIQRKIVTFPSLFFMPKAIYRFIKGAAASQVMEVLEDMSRVKGGGKYLGELKNVKTNVSKHPYKVFFRAPYDVVDKELLDKYDIKSKSQYEALLHIPNSTESCTLKKIIQNKSANWDAFLSSCLEQRPSFNE